MKSFTLSLFLLCLVPNFINAQSITGQALLKKSIQYHDAKGKWAKFKGTLRFTETRPNGDDRQSIVKLNNRKAYFYLGQNREGYKIEKMVENDVCQYKVNGSASVEDRCKLIKKLQAFLNESKRNKRKLVKPASTRPLNDRAGMYGQVSKP